MKFALLQKRNSLNEEEKAEYRRKQAEATRLRRRQVSFMELLTKYMNSTI